MENIQIIQVEGVEHIMIDRGNGEYTSMLKNTWEELQAARAEHLNGSVDGEAL